jgi:CheY-like chemotaxis protein
MNLNNGEKPAILVVEDDYDNQKFLKVFLQRNFRVLTCDSEESFYQYLNDDKIDIILMDISLRGKKDGLQLTKEIKNSSQYKKIPIVCLTAHAFQQDRENALNAGADIFLTKPISNNYLMDTLLDLVDKAKGNEKPF